MAVLTRLMLCVVSMASAGWPQSQPSPPKVKNVLFLVSDDLRASALGCYGNPRCQSPNIDRLAERGRVFERAYCQGTVCNPSRNSFLFSRYRGRGEVNVAQLFRQRGWYSARVGKIFHMRVPGDIIPGTDGKDIPESWTERFNSPGREAHTPGDYACLNLSVFTDELEGRQSTGMPHRAFVSVKYDGDGSDQPDHRSATKAVELLREHGEEPFFLAVGFVRPHYPMVAPRQFFEPYDWEEMVLPPQVEGDLEDIPPAGRAGSRSATNGLAKYPDNQKRMWAAYYAAVTFMDAQVGRILDELDRLALRDNTAIVFTSDHGYHLGDHTFWQKANLHEQVTRVPLIVAGPGLEPGRSGSIVELVDLYPTLCELAGLEPPSELQGESLVPILEVPTATVKKGALSYWRQGYSWRTSDWAYLRYADGSEELYDMRTDPDQITNLAGRPDHRETKARLAKQLDERLRSADLAERSGR